MGQSGSIQAIKSGRCLTKRLVVSFCTYTIDTIYYRLALWLSNDLTSDCFATLLLLLNLLVLRLPIAESLSSRGKFTKLVSYHFFRHWNWHMMFSVMYEKLEADSSNKKEMSACLPESTSSQWSNRTHPTKLGNTVQERAFVRIGVLFLSAWARLGNETKKGPR